MFTTVRGHATCKRIWARETIPEKRSGSIRLQGFGKPAFHGASEASTHRCCAEYRARNGTRHAGDQAPSEFPVVLRPFRGRQLLVLPAGRLLLESVHPP